MPALVNCSGDEDFRHGGSMYGSVVETGLYLGLGSHVDYYPPCKRSRVAASFVFKGDMFVQAKQSAIDVLPEECLFEILRRLPVGGEDRSASACVSKKWLNIVSTIRKDEFVVEELKNSGVVAKENVSQDEIMEDVESDGHLTRSLEGKKATDTRLASMAVGTASRGGLGKLMIRGSNTTRGVTNFGLMAIGRGCPSLKAFSVWNVNTIGDEGLIEIAQGCPKLEKLDLCQCPFVTNKGLLAIAANCPNLTSLTLESCENIGDEGLQAIGRGCSKLESVSIKDCSMVGPDGVGSLVSSVSAVLKKVKLQGLNINDNTLGVIGLYGRAITDLVLTGLQIVTERGFWVMGYANGLQKLKSVAITSCRGVTDASIEAVGKGCPNLKQLCLRKCCFVSDNGIVSFAKTAMSLESLALEECNRITQVGVLSAISSCGEHLKAISLVKCMGIRDIACSLAMLSPCRSLRSLTIRDCPGFGSASLAMVGKLCPQLQNVDLSGLFGVTDAGFLPLVDNNESGLVKVNLNRCGGITDAAMSLMARLHGETLQVLSLDGCRKITDATLFAIAENSKALRDLDISKCAISDVGVAALACGKHLKMEILSLSGCSRLTDNCVPYLAKMGQTMVGLNVQHCNSISSSMIDLLVERLWRCDILS